MKFKSEENRIIEKICNRKTFQTETWTRLYFIFDVLIEDGFQKRCDFQKHNTNHFAWQYYFMDNNNIEVRVLVSEFLGSYIQVEFGDVDIFFD